MNRYKLTTLIVAALLFSFACNKQNVPICCGANPSNVSIYHVWNIVSDSANTGVGATNHPVAYAGQPGDYFNVTTNGVIYTNEGGVLDTLKYSSLTDSTIVISSFGIILNGAPSVSHYSFSANAMHIASPMVTIPAGEFGRKVTLSR